MSDNNNESVSNTNTNNTNINNTTETTNNTIKTESQVQIPKNIKLKDVDLDTFKGPRYTKLCMVFDKALTKSIDTFSVNKLKKSFPLLAKHDEKGLTKAHAQVTEFLRRESEIEYAKIVANRKIIRKLNTLDYPENGKKLNLENLLKCDPNQLLLNVCYNEKKRTLEDTQNELEALRAQNLLKMQKLGQLNHETVKLAAKLKNIGKDFNEAFEVAKLTSENLE